MQPTRERLYGFFSASLHSDGNGTHCVNLNEGGINMNSKTLFYILKRVLLAVLTVWVVITITFFVSRAVPGGPFLGEKAISAAAQAALEAKYARWSPPAP